MLTNVVRHARATMARVRVMSDGQLVQVVVDDDGTGAGDASPRLGWLGMRERVTAHGGRLDLGTAPEGGVRLDARIPVGGL